MTPIPWLGFESERFYLRGLVAGARYRAGANVELRGFGQVRMRQFDASDSAVLAGMDERRRTLEAGIGIRLGPPWLRADLSATRDVLGRHGGLEAQAELSVPWRVRQWAVTASVGAAWQSEDFTGYYYGVSPHEATVARPAYAPGSVLNPQIGLNVRYGLRTRTNWVLILGQEWLDDAIHDSPIVEDSTRWTAVFGISRQL